MKDSTSIQFLGAAGTVTGSKHLLKTPGFQILIDCGLFQGLKSLRLKNREPFPVDVRSINVVLLTHAHLDHCGYLPLLFKNGYKGKVLMTPPTRTLTEIILRDSAKIQEEDAARANKHGFSRHKPALPLYTIEDVDYALNFFEEVNENEWTTLSENLKCRFQRNGHIIGSCFIEIDAYGKRIVFSGDIGRENSLTLSPPTVISKADVLVMESTYGNKLHPGDRPDDQLAEAVNDAITRGGNVLIPSFAVGRAQELMLIVQRLKEAKLLPDVPVYLDSPMGREATKAFVSYPEWHKLSPGECDVLISSTKIVSEYSETKRILNDTSSKVVIAASGMLSGGRVLEYLKKYLNDPKNLILIAGYQVEGSRGRDLKDGAPDIKIFRKYFKVKAEIREITSLSAHGDQQEMLNWLSKFTSFPQKIFLVHGEPSALDCFRKKIHDTFKVEPVIPNELEEHSIF